MNTAQWFVCPQQNNSVWFGEVEKNQNSQHLHSRNCSTDKGARTNALYNASTKIKNMMALTLLENHRDPIVDDIIDLYAEKKNKYSK